MLIRSITSAYVVIAKVLNRSITSKYVVTTTRVYRILAAGVTGQQGMLLLNGTWSHLLFLEVRVVQCSLSLYNYVFWTFLTILTLVSLILIHNNQICCSRYTCLSEIESVHLSYQLKMFNQREEPCDFHNISLC